MDTPPMPNETVTAEHVADSSAALVAQPRYRAPSLMPFGAEWDAMREQADILVKSGFLPPDLNTAEKVIAVLLTGREIGVPPMQAVRGIHVVNGRPSLSAELMLALAYQNIAGFRFKIEMTTNEICKIVASRPGGDPVTIMFTIGDAERAGLARGQNWIKYPAAMLRARATSAVLRIVAPDAIRGFHTPEEMGRAERDVEVEKLAQARGEPVPMTGVVTQNQEIP